MKKSALLFSLLALLCISLSAQDTPSAIHSDATASRKERLQQHIYFLAADSLHGREAGTSDAAKARAYLIDNYTAMGLEAWKNDTLAVSFTWDRQDTPYTNLIGVIRGTDPVLRDEYIVLGTHYDHIGMKNDTTVYNGADDNASGTAALMEITRDLLAHRADLKRSVLIAAFDAEEKGLYGSTALSRLMEDEGVNVRLMMSIDMVGWLKAENRLTLEGTGTIRNGNQILRSEADRLGLSIHCKDFESSILTATDTEGFAQNGIPTLAITTGLKSPYHKPGDDADLIDYDGLELVTRYLTAITTSFATDTSFKPSGHVSFKHRHYPDYGVRLAAVAGWGNSGLAYPKGAAIDGRSLGGTWQAGFSGKLNLKHFAVAADVLYGQQRYLLPDPADYMNSACRYKQQTLTVPVSLIIQTAPRSHPVNFWLGAGGWYRHAFSDGITDSKAVAVTPDLLGYDPTLRPDDYGYHICFGVSIYNVAIEGCSMHGLQTLFDNPDAPAFKPRTYMCNVKWYF